MPPPGRARPQPSVPAHFIQETTMASRRKATTPQTVLDRINDMLATYEVLDAEAHEIIDAYIEDVVRPRCPGIPTGVLRQCEIDGRAGRTLNIPEALRLLRQAKG